MLTACDRVLVNTCLHLESPVVQRVPHQQDNTASKAAVADWADYCKVSYLWMWFRKHMFAITLHFGQQLRETIGIAVTGSQI